MVKTQQSVRIRLQAAVMVMTLLAAWCFTSGVLASVQSTSCSMTCCISERHCCCSLPKSFAKDHSNYGSTFIDNAHLLDACSKECILAQHFRSSLLHNENCASHPVEAGNSSLILAHSFFSLFNSLEFNPCSPRPPPAS